MTIPFSFLLLALWLSLLTPPSYAQGYSDRDRNIQEQIRQADQRQLTERQRDYQMTLEDIRREGRRLQEDQDRLGRQTLPSGGSPTFAGVAEGIAAVGIMFAFDAVFASQVPAAGSNALRSFAPNASTRRWLEDPFNQPGVPRKFDTPDGLISKICFAPFPDTQTVVYRWDAPNEQSWRAEIREIPTREHLQFTHPTAQGMFIYVSGPSPGHQPSDKLYWLAAHRIGMTGCGHAQAYRIHYPKLGGPPAFETLQQKASAPLGPGTSELPDEQQAPFVRGCKPVHGSSVCLCLLIRYSILGLPSPAHLAQYPYDHPEISEAIRKNSQQASRVERECKARR